MFIAVVLVFVVGWIAANTVLHALHMVEFDVAPFPWLQGVVALNALLISRVVLIRQNRLAKLAQQRAHLDLRVMLLTEHKAAKLIDLIEELRRDLRNVRDRHDSTAVALQQAMNPDLVREALDLSKTSREPTDPGHVEPSDSASDAGG